MVNFKDQAIFFKCTSTYKYSMKASMFEMLIVWAGLKASMFELSIVGAESHKGDQLRQGRRKNQSHK